MRPSRRYLFSVLAPAFLAAQPAPEPSAPPAPAPAQRATPTTDDLFQLGEQLFNRLAPPEIKAEFEFPSKQQWDEFAARLQTASEGDDLGALAESAPQARAALAALQFFPEYADYADWLKARLDGLEAAEQIADPKPAVPPPAPTPPAKTPAPTAAPGEATPRPPKPSAEPPQPIPHYERFLARARATAAPGRAAALLPPLRAAFIAEGVPPELVWLAEAESTFNPAARSPAGARGLYQLMPETARSLGLSTFLPDDRTDPEKSARAAARLLRAHYEKFGSWPLALAAYNAGAGRVTRLLEKTSSKTYAGIAAALPAETRLYVPKVCALVTARAGVTPDKIPAPDRG